MLRTKIMMGMPIILEVIDREAKETDLEDVFSYFDQVDHKFSTYKENSEISRINRGELEPFEMSEDMKKVLGLSQETNELTDGYFDIVDREGKIDPSGLVKGWAIFHAAEIFWSKGFNDFYINAGGDIQVSGKNQDGGKWRVGILDPFDPKQIVKTVHVTSEGVATSGIYIRGEHIYDPKNKNKKFSDIVSLTVIGPNVYEADRFATAAFAMGKRGIAFIDNLPGFEGYMIDKDKVATMTANFQRYVQENN